MRTILWGQIPHSWGHDKSAPAGITSRQALDSTRSLPVDGIKSATADSASLVDMEAPSDHRPVIARFNL
jgi:hypothetical protein